MSFCPLESYKRVGMKAECGSSGVLLMASLLPICDIRSGAQGKCQGRKGCVSASVCVYRYICISVCEGDLKSKKGEEDKRFGETG